MMKGTPSAQLDWLDDLWFQISGTLCNLTCHHCFISCGPTNRTFETIPKDDVFRKLEESRAFGVKEYYFTGGEPFIHPHMVEILERTLAIGPATVLTNATLLRQDWIARLARAETRSPYSLEFRVSIDGFSPAMNDPIRGQGTFERAMQGTKLLLTHDFLPVITVAQTWDDDRNDEVHANFVKVLKDAGYERPRVKIIPTLRLGAEIARNRGYESYERITAEMLEEFDESQLICTHSRVVTDRGVYVCPILIDSPEARVGDTLATSLEPYPLKHGACYTCYLGGAICANPSTGGNHVA